MAESDCPEHTVLSLFIMASNAEINVGITSLAACDSNAVAGSQEMGYRTQFKWQGNKEEGVTSE